MKMPATLPLSERLHAVETVLAASLGLREASLVIHRRGLLVEFKTEALVPGLCVEHHAGRRSWQLGPFEGHHCHLDLAAVHLMEFDAEPVSCQGGRLNYTLWFLGEVDCGNPYRPQGLFSVTLNRPYASDGAARTQVIQPVYALHQKFRNMEFVKASPGFLNAPSGHKSKY